MGKEINLNKPCLEESIKQMEEGETKEFMTDKLNKLNKAIKQHKEQVNPMDSVTVKRLS